MQTHNSTPEVFAVQVICLPSHKEFNTVNLVVICFSGLPATFGLLTAGLSPIFFFFFLQKILCQNVSNWGLGSVAAESRQRANVSSAVALWRLTTQTVS